MAAPTNVKEPVDFVHQDLIHLDTILKEQRHQKLYTTFNVNPFKKLHVLADKPMSREMYKEAEDPVFLELFHRANLEPKKKYPHPMTESQEIGWISTPLIESDRSDRRLNFPRRTTEITKYMGAVWRLKEQAQRSQKERGKKG
ncbi:cilia- and flagella-associated protein 144-like [Neoarius graeffei]|uniref:cilia- and flagella-associated protein 144-like n=1 Tax=Neoarius graeffei TaxID=443677 RepID=UPI00298D200B|nr:cilia- and flagella-associated protein 144-like [Neoarius graeffei]